MMTLDEGAACSRRRPTTSVGGGYRQELERVWKVRRGQRLLASLRHAAWIWVSPACRARAYYLQYST